jgi:hypothetical protein
MEEAMLAYVFWHWRRSGVDREAYEAAQRRFHEALAEAPPAGFLISWTSRIAGASWLPGAGDGEAYEDWYVVDGSAALDALNDAAITASRRQPHDAAATLAAGGTAGLYRMRAGSLLRRPTHASWFSKPPGTDYASLLADCSRAVVDAPHCLWMRQMVLGPTPEFCLQGVGPLALPYPVATVVSLEPVWSA